MNRIKILDCTLRDGGYINNWNFGKKNIIKIINNLQESSVDIIEIGFLQDNYSYTGEETVFSSISQIDNVLDECNEITAQKVAMIMLGKFDKEKIPARCDTKLDGIRVCFKKNQINEAMEYCKDIIKKGYDLYIQPASLTDYSDKDVLDLVEKVNKLEKICALYIVDTYGLMQKDDVERFFHLINNNLNKGVPIGFHSHNNLQLSFSNSQAILGITDERFLFIDSSVYGMGRGAGNLCSELIMQYLNTNYSMKYNLIPILELVDDCIMKIFNNTPWGYSVAYYVAAINKCHPNYATYLMNKQTIGVKDINSILKRIPEPSKRNYNEKMILNLYTEYLEHKFDDKYSIEQLKEKIKNKKVLIIAPGKSILNEINTIKQFIADENPYIISVNFKPDIIPVDAVFVSNMKRYQGIEVENEELLYTSNIVIGNKMNNSIEFDYESYLNHDEIVCDNATLMLLNLLIKCMINKVSIAGFDGYKTDSDNYYDSKLISNMNGENFELINKSIIKYLEDSNLIDKIEFVTRSNYEKNKVK